MADFGICQNDEQCELSYRRDVLNNLFHRVDVVERIEARGADFTGQLPFLKHFEAFFQSSSHCARCGKPVYRVIQPTQDLKPASEEYIRLRRLNQLLEVGYKLQVWMVLPEE